MLTPVRYWRLPCSLTEAVEQPSENFNIGEKLAGYANNPKTGHGITIAAYDSEQRTGFLQWVGIIVGGTGTERLVEWKPTNARIDVDTAQGAKFWEGGAFGFASNKVAGYGLHELWQQHFELELRERTPGITHPVGPRLSRHKVSAERLDPIEVVGKPTIGPRAGVVYVLKSASGYKVGRTKNVPARMRAFGVLLPFVYTIPLCAWFEDCHEAEKRYHNRFASKRINGEWFDLTEQDLEDIRRRA